ncbi:helix-turn-helix domain-containing protein [Kordiimonas marina]|uniref:helix-turn-helix domain-containing protein n=1 Tax=Kordiimonas marina TaxID=2872312 RepID=UPI001FF3EA7C|nr:helix-turn-helix domain-containing protein [Kordiimonas marina]MCJ9428579.1 helix-turn-helix domain-containing protein [Kordiimonas marina]
MTNHQSDMPEHEIMYELRCRGLTYAAIDVKYGFPDHTSANAASRPDPKAEVAIAAELGKQPKDIWPSRYGQDGRRLRPQPRENYSGKPREAKRQNERAA